MAYERCYLSIIRILVLGPAYIGLQNNATEDGTARAVKATSKSITCLRPCNLDLEEMQVCNASVLMVDPDSYNMHHLKGYFSFGRHIIFFL